MRIAAHSTTTLLALLAARLLALRSVPAWRARRETGGAPRRHAGRARRRAPTRQGPPNRDRHLVRARLLRQKDGLRADAHARLVGVANRTLPCGTLVQVSYGGHPLTVPVLDRGPYANRRRLGPDGRSRPGARHHRNGPHRHPHRRQRPQHPHARSPAPPGDATAPPGRERRHRRRRCRLRQLMSALSALATPRARPSDPGAEQRHADGPRAPPAPRRRARPRGTSMPTIAPPERRPA